jgi:hypothetical protein
MKRALALAVALPARLAAAGAVPATRKFVDDAVRSVALPRRLIVLPR